ncbi:MAG: ABC transporter permease subunit [Chloroflexota bacterium]
MRNTEIKRISPARFWPVLLVAAVYLVNRLVPDAVPDTGGDNLAWLLLVLGLAGTVNLVAAIGWRRGSPALIERGVVIIALLLLLWELIVPKLGLLTPPFFPPVGRVIGVFGQDIGLLVTSTLHSLRILALGYLLGAAIGVSLGFLVGWYRRFRWWGVPVIKVVGPIPATALTALAIAIFPGLLGSVFLIAFAVTFPVFMNTWSGVAGIPKPLLETAQNLGADNRFLVWRVVLPAVSPSIFTGLYIGLLVSFLTLVVAEMLGVNAGLGWYIWRAQGWAEYYRVYAAVIVMGLIFSTLLTALFTFRDHLLRWQKGMVRW